MRDDNPNFRAGDKIQVEVVSFGPLGASVEVIGLGHGDDADLLSADEEPYGTGLILQKEIAYFRQSRNSVDVVRGEVVPAYIQNVREDGKIDVGLRVYGGKAKSQEVGSVIMERLNGTTGGSLPIGDKSSPEEISKEFPGVSKSAFKNAVGSLYKKGLIQPLPNSITLK
jgi:predicted RNA-binding protein (virulence factor B family)